MRQNKNYQQWKNLHIEWDNLDDFRNRWGGEPGVHTVIFSNSNIPVDLYANEHIKNSNFESIAVFFTGAVSARAGKKGPFFSGLGISGKNKIPMIAISDPTLDKDPELSLAWYLTGPDDRFADNLKSTLEAVYAATGKELILVGGSGGGFAALNFAAKLDCESSVLVWNPQTDIYDYAERFVKQYLRSQFNFSHASLARPDWKSYCRLRTDRVLTTSVVGRDTLTRPKRVVYLQNESDWHKDKHLKPLWNTVSQVALGSGLNELDPQHVVLVKDFASGHTPPPPSLIAEILIGLLPKRSVAKEVLQDHIS